METTEQAFEAEVELDSDAVRQEQSKRPEEKGRKAASLSAGGIDIDTSDSRHSTEGDANEQSPLLRRRDGEDDNEDGSPAWHGMAEFEGLPWYKQPSIYWVLGPFFLMATAFGGVIAPKVNLIKDLVCNRYFSDMALADPNFTMVPIDFTGGHNDQCRIPEVQQQVTAFVLWCTLIGGILSAITSPKLGALSDRYGRKKILVCTSVGTILGEIITICAAMYPETFPVDLILLSYALDGLTGSFIVAMAVSNAYATDCTPPASRNIAFGYFHGCLFTGVALGPIVAGYVAKPPGKILYVFYILTAVHIFFILFVALFVPESLSKKRQLAAREKHKTLIEETGHMQQYRHLNLLAPLKVLWPTGPGASPALRRNLFFLSAVDTIVFGVAMGSMMIIIVYTNYMFGWETFESGRFMSIVNSSRVFCLIIVLPSLTRYVRGPPSSNTDEKHRNTGCDAFDVNVIRASVFFDTVGYLGYTLSRRGEMMILSGVVAAFGGIGSPTLQSSLTKHVPAEQTGQVLGASGLLHALARVVAPTIFNSIYYATVKHFPQTVFVCLAATFGLAFLLSWFIKTNGMCLAVKASPVVDLHAEDSQSTSTKKRQLVRATTRTEGTTTTAAGPVSQLWIPCSPGSGSWARGLGYPARATHDSVLFCLWGDLLRCLTQQRRGSCYLGYRSILYNNAVTHFGNRRGGNMAA